MRVGKLTLLLFLFLGACAQKGPFKDGIAEIPGLTGAPPVYENQIKKVGTLPPMSGQYQCNNGLIFNISFAGQ
jgi:hypothetical protein